MTRISRDPYQYKEEKQIRQATLEKLKKAMEPYSNMSEDEKKAYSEKINKKIKNGEKLTQSELEYIKRTNPIMYLHVKRVQMKREMLENKLKKCKSKKEVDDAYNEAVSRVDSKDPDMEALVKAYQKVTDEFKKTSKYQMLPEEIKEDEKRMKEKDTEDILNASSSNEIVEQEFNSFDVKI